MACEKVITCNIITLAREKTGLRTIGEAMTTNFPQNNSHEAPGSDVKARPKAKRPSMYKVLMINDNYTPMEFVIHILEGFFNKERGEATQIMLQVHQRGVGICGVFTREVAETKVQQVVDFAREHQHPLQCTFEKE